MGSDLIAFGKACVNRADEIEPEKRDQLDLERLRTLIDDLRVSQKEIHRLAQFLRKTEHAHML